MLWEPINQVQSFKSKVKFLNKLDCPLFTTLTLEMILRTWHRNENLRSVLAQTSFGQNIAYIKIFCRFWLTCANCRKRDWLKGRTKTKAIAWAKFIKKPTLTKMMIKGRRIDWSPILSETKLSLNYYLPNKIIHKFFMKKLTFIRSRNWRIIDNRLRIDEWFSLF